VGGAAMLPLAAGSQQRPAMPVIGFLSAGPPVASYVAGFRKGVNALGYAEGLNLAIEFHITEQYDRLPALVAELVRRRVAVIFAPAVEAAQAAKAAPTTIPIVFTNGADPVEIGLVASLARPGGNVTGVTFLAAEMTPKRLELLRELLPQATMIAFLVNPANSQTDLIIRTMQGAARGVRQN